MELDDCPGLGGPLPDLGGPLPAWRATMDGGAAPSNSSWRKSACKPDGGQPGRVQEGRGEDA